MLVIFRVVMLSDGFPIGPTYNVRGVSSVVIDVGTTSGRYQCM